MTITDEACRVTVHGPGGRADLAVPLSVSVASLLPVLLRHTGGDADGGWVLQRLGGVPLDPAGTPESLDWRHGEELYLRPAAEALPELDVDDVADGVAVAVGRRAGRWRAEYNRWLFLGLSAAVLVVLGRVLLYPGPPALAAGSALVAGVLLLGGAVVAGGRTSDRVLVALLGLAGCGLVGLAAAVGAPGARAVAGGTAVALSAAAVLGARAVWARAVPFTPFGALAAVGMLAAVAQWLGQTWPAVPAAAVLCLALFVVVIFAPRLAIRLARVRGPQLPRTAEELQDDIAPVPATEVATRTGYADAYLTIAAVAAAAVFAGATPVLVDGGVFATILAGLVASAALLRARVFLGAGQRVALAAAGAFGLGWVALSVIGRLDLAARTGSLVLLGGVFVASLLAMLRPPGRRLLPIWGHLANGLETLSAVAIVPVLLQLFDVYARVG